MKCQKCNQREANTHITQIINGKKAEIYLCPECAGESQELFAFKTNPDSEFDSLFSNFWNSFPAPSKEKQASASPKQCEICRTTLGEFLSSGKPGCSNCYTVFADYLLRPVKQIHGAVHHTGKIPLRSGKELKTAGLIDELQSRLNRAVMDQNFEEAALLRDRINELKNNPQ